MSSRLTELVDLILAGDAPSVQNAFASNRFDLNEKDVCGCSALHYACASAHADTEPGLHIIKALLREGADAGARAPFSHAAAGVDPAAADSDAAATAADAAPFSVDPFDVFRTNAVVSLPGNREILTTGKAVRGTFESVRYNVALRTGRWYYEVTVVTSGLFQIGWATPTNVFKPEEGEGVGDDAASYAFDGFRQLKWHAGKYDVYGTAWQSGDVVGCSLDLERRLVRFALNGTDLGVAFELPGDGGAPEALTPAASMDEHQLCVFNLGDQPFRFRQDDSFRAVLDAVRVPPAGCAVSRYFSLPRTPSYQGLPLHWAIECGNVEAARVLVGASRRVFTETDVRGWTPLMCAMHRGMKDICELLVDEMLSVHPDLLHCTDAVYQRSLFHFAAFSGQLGLLSKLLEASGKKTVARDVFGWSALDCALIGGQLEHLDCVRLLLDSQPGLLGQTDHDSNRITPLHRAVFVGVRDPAVGVYLVELLLNRDADPNARDSTESTPLMDAAFLGLLPIVRTLLKKGAKFGLVDVNGYNVLHKAVFYGHLDVVDEFLARGVPIDTASEKEGGSPLSLAAGMHQVECVRHLLRQGADPNFLDPLSATAMNHACASDDLTIVKMLFEHGGKLDLPGMDSGTPLHDAVWGGYLDCAEWLLEHGAVVDSLDEELRTPLHYAARRGSTAIVKLLLSKGAAIDSRNRDGFTPAQQAARHGKVDCLLMLLEAGADPNSFSNTGLTGLHQAAAQGYVKCIEALIAKGATIEPVDQQGRVPLHYAAFCNHCDCIELLLRHGADVNKPDTANLSSPLHIAVRADRLEAARLLISRGAKVNYCSRDWYPIHEACTLGFLECVKLLIKEGADVNAVADAGFTPLHCAAAHGKLACLSTLLAAGATVDARCMIGLTPLLAAAKFGHIDCVRTLVLSKADVRAVDLEGRSAWHWANARTHMECAAYLYGREQAAIAAAKSVLPITAGPVSGDLWTFGEGTDGQLGHSDISNEPLPRRVQALLGQRVARVFCGGSHVLALTDDGSLFAWGQGVEGQLGVGYKKLLATPLVVPFFTGKTVRQLACGATHSLALLENETGGTTVLAWGGGKLGQLGLGDVKQTPNPQQLPSLTSAGIVSIACGKNSSFAIADSGIVYSWGASQYGQLGHPDAYTNGIPDNVLVPKEVASLKFKCIRSLAAGDSHCVALSDRGDVFTWGRSIRGQLGHGKGLGMSPPTVVGALRGKRVRRVVAGAEHTAAVLDDGSMYIWGNNNHGQCGQPLETVSVKSPALLEDVCGESRRQFRVRDVACGESHTVFTTESGHVYLLGLNYAAGKKLADASADAGNAVNAAFVEQKTFHRPAVLEPMRGKRVRSVAAGRRFSAVVTEALTGLGADLRAFVNNQSLSDVRLSLGDGTEPLAAHRVVLSCRCERFRAALDAALPAAADVVPVATTPSSASNEVPPPVVDCVALLPGVGREALLAVLTFLYTDLLDAPPSLIGDVNDAAERLGLPKLSLLCSAFSAQPDETAAQLDVSRYPTLSADLSKAVASEECSDVALLCDDGSRVPCHRVVLAARSGYFSSMFEGGMKESRLREVSLPDLDPEIAMAILKHLYGEVSNVTPDNALDLLAATNLYRLEQLKSLCEMALMQWIDVDNAVNLLQAAEMHSASMLKAFCKNFISMNFDSIANVDEIPEFTINLDDLGIRKRLRKIKAANTGDSSDEEDPHGNRRRRNGGGSDDDNDDEEEDPESRWAQFRPPRIPGPLPAPD